MLGLLADEARETAHHGNNWMVIWGESSKKLQIFWIRCCQEEGAIQWLILFYINIYFSIGG